jgi:hypothetical protein
VRGVEIGDALLGLGFLMIITARRRKTGNEII